MKHNIELLNETIRQINGIIDSLDKSDINSCDCSICEGLKTVKATLSEFVTVDDSEPTVVVRPQIELDFEELFQDMFSAYRYDIPREVLVKVTDIILDRLTKDKWFDEIIVKATEGIKIKLQLVDQNGLYKLEYVVLRWGRVIGASEYDFICLPNILRSGIAPNGYVMPSEGEDDA